MRRVVDRTKTFPWDESSDRVLELAAALKSDDRSDRAEYLREVAGSIEDHRR